MGEEGEGGPAWRASSPELQVKGGGAAWVEMRWEPGPGRLADGGTEKRAARPRPEAACRGQKREAERPGEGGGGEGGERYFGGGWGERSEGEGWLVATHMVGPMGAVYGLKYI